MIDNNFSTYNTKQIKQKEQISQLEEETQKSLIKLFSSNKFMILTIINSISYILLLYILIKNITLYSFLMLFFPTIILYGLWYTYNNISKVKLIRTEGLILIKNVILIVLLILQTIASIFIILGLLDKISLFVVLGYCLVILFIYLCYRVFNNILKNTIDAFDKSKFNANYFTDGVVLLIAIGILNFIVTLLIILAKENRLIPYFSAEHIEIFTKVIKNIDYSLIYKMIIDTIFCIYLAYFIFNTGAIMKDYQYKLENKEFRNL